LLKTIYAAESSSLTIGFPSGLSGKYSTNSINYAPYLDSAQILKSSCSFLPSGV